MLVSVVMPSLNQAQYLGEAISSVLEQSYRDVELIIADGGSTDATLGILERMQKSDPRLRWFSRNDRGPAHAINGAFDLARGTFVGWLNSDDIYAPNAIGRAVDSFTSDPRLLMTYGHGVHINSSGQLLDCYPTLPPSTPIEHFSEGCFICQPTMFYRRTALILLGKLDEELKASFDFDYWLRAFTAFPDRIGFVDAVQAHSRLHENCITMRLRRTVALEGMQVLSRHLGSAPKEWVLTYIDELMQSPDFSLVRDKISEDIATTVGIANQWLSTKEKFELETAIKRRMNGQ